MKQFQVNRYFIFISTLFVLPIVTSGEDFNWKCDFNTDDCLFTTNVPPQVSLYKFQRGSMKFSDHQGKTGSYLYAKFHYTYDQEAFIYSPVFNISTKTAKVCLKYYFWIGDNGDQVQIYGLKNGNVISRRGSYANPSQTKRWQQATLVYDQPIDQFIIKAERDYSSQETLAIDDIELYDCSHNSPTSTQKPTAPAIKTIDEIACSFDGGDFCLFKNTSDPDSKYYWTTGKNTPSSSTGPSSPVDGKGKFAFAEASKCKKASVANLTSPIFSTYSPKCISYFYNLHGSHIGGLQVSVYDFSSHSQQTYNLSDDLSQDRWIKHTTRINYMGIYRLTFKAICGSGFRGDVAIDKLTIHDCPLLTTPAIQTTSRQPPIVASTISSTKAPVAGSTQSIITDSSKLAKILNSNFDSQNYGQYTVTKSPGNKKYVWSLSNKRTSVDTGPKEDISTKGYFLYTEASGCSSGDVTNFTSPVITLNKLVCQLTFYYHMYGSEIGTFRVSTYNANTKATTILLEKRGEIGLTWQKKIIRLQPGQYQLIFTGICSNSFRGDIAIDNITVNECHSSHITPKPTISQTSPKMLECSFERDFCQYYPNSKSTYSWRIGNKTNSLGTGPQVPYSGNFVYFEATGGNARRMTILESPVVYIDTTTCLSFVYHMYGLQIGRFVVSLISYQNDERTLVNNQTILDLSGHKGDVWTRFSYTINANQNSPNLVKLFFTGFYGGGFRGDISFDEIKIQSQACSQVSMTTMKPFSKTSNTTSKFTPTLSSIFSTRIAPTTNFGTAVSPEKLNCDFEKNMCMWTATQNPTSKPNNYIWTRHSGLTPSSNTGPDRDHTIGDGLGHYVYVEATGSKLNYYSELKSPLLNMNNEDFCMEVYYHMHGSKSKIGIFEIFGNSPNSADKLLFKMETSKENRWHQLLVTLNSSDSIDQIIFKATSDGDYRGDIAIDDISFTRGACKVSGSKPASRCSFENDECGFSRSADHLTWSFRRLSSNTPSVGTGPQYAYDGKYYMYAEATNSPISSVATLTSSLYQMTGISCISFVYHMLTSQDDNAGILHIFLQNNNILHPVVAEKGNKGYFWINQEIQTSFSSFKIVFKAVRGYTFESDIAIDDLNITSGKCQSTNKVTYPVQNQVESVDCNFETDMCGYKLVQDIMNPLEWTRKEDIQTTSNKVLHIGGVYTKSSTSGIFLESPLIKSFNSNKCLSWKMSQKIKSYSIMNQDFPLLNFHIRKRGSNSFKKVAELIEESKKSCSDDNSKKQLNIDLENDIEQFRIEALTTKKLNVSVVTIDDFILKDGKCPTIKSSSIEVGLNHANCGKRRSSSFIVQGEKALIGEYPWQVTLSILVNGDNYLCGGVLIHESFVLTAGHCIKKNADYTIYLGSVSKYGGESYKASQAMPHPDYPSPVRHLNDIAIIKLKTKVKMTDKINTACLSDDNLTGNEGYDCYVSGFGRTSGEDGSPTSQVLMKTKQNIFTESACKSYLSDFTLSSVSYPKMVCGKGVSFSTSQACKGDSGGPLSCKKSGKWYAAGVVSWGLTGCKGGISVFAQTAPYYKWITEVIREEEKCL